MAPPKERESIEVVILDPLDDVAQLKADQADATQPRKLKAA
jgi:hypothetical protein